MRNIIVWSLSILLGLEPAVFAASPTGSASVKNWVEQTEVTKRQVSLQEFLEASTSNMPPEMRKQVEDYFKENNLSAASIKLPKFDASKYEDSKGREIFKLQAVQNGQAVTLEIIGRDDVFMKINGTAFSKADMNSVPTLVSKLNAPQMQNQPQQLLSAEQIQMLPMAQRVQYFKQLRQLLESMEAVQQVRFGQKTSRHDFSSKWNAIAQLLAMSEAFADGGGVVPPSKQTGKSKKAKKGKAAAAEQDSGQDQQTSTDCVAGGWVAQVGFNKSSGRTTCGTDGKGGVPEQFRQRASKEACGRTQFACNPLLYGSNDLCIPAGRDTTLECNRRITGNDIPDLSKNPEQFNELKAKAERQAQELDRVCKGASSHTPGLKEDQEFTCENFQSRWTTIKSWTCTDASFAKSYPAICPVIAEKPPVTGPVTQVPGPQTPPAKDAPDCNKLPDNMSLSQKECVGGNAPLSGRCYDGDTKREAYICECDAGKMIIGKMTCGNAGGTGSTDKTSKRGKKTGEEDSKWPKWLLPLGAGIAAIAAYYFLNRSANKEAAKQVDPQLQNPPVAPPLTPSLPVPTTPPPTPRTVQ